MMITMKWLCCRLWLFSLALVSAPVMADTTWQQTGGPTGGECRVTCHRPGHSTDHLCGGKRQRRVQIHHRRQFLDPDQQRPDQPLNKHPDNRPVRPPDHVCRDTWRWRFQILQWRRFWVAVNSGLGNNYGNISFLATDPFTPQIVYAGTTASGVFKGLSDPTVPGAPTNVTATAGNAQDTVSFTPPHSNGGNPITSYIVTANPGNITATGSSSPITVTGLTNSTAYTFTVKAANDFGESTEASASTNLYGLSVTMNGTGDGSVYNTSSGTTCTNGTCIYNSNVGTMINLTQSASNGSRFSGWGGACTDTGSCAVPMNTLFQSVTALFEPLPNARILGNPHVYGLLQSAYNDAATGAVIQAKGLTFAENLTMDTSKDVTLAGGFDPDFLTQADYTILQGILSVGQGSIVLERLIIE